MLVQSRRLEAQHPGISANVAAPVRQYKDWELNDAERVAQPHSVNGSPLRYSLLTLPPCSTHLQVKGKVPVVATLNSIACSILIERNFAPGISRL